MYEIITGRKANDKVLEYAQVIGFIFLITLVIYATEMTLQMALHIKYFCCFFFTNNCLFYIWVIMIKNLYENLFFYAFFYFVNIYSQERKLALKILLPNIKVLKKTKVVK